jgi:transposase
LNGAGKTGSTGPVAGKPAKVALTACMRKLLTILNMMVRSNTHWQHAHAAG